MFNEQNVDNPKRKYIITENLKLLTKWIDWNAFTTNLNRIKHNCLTAQCEKKKNCLCACGAIESENL